MSLVGVYEGLTEASLQALAARFAASLSNDAMSSDPSLSWPLLIEMQGPLGAPEARQLLGVDSAAQQRQPVQFQTVSHLNNQITEYCQVPAKEYHE